jgi:ubiquinone/menaquinone biosynthesis C-methylase UbiE
MKTQPNFDLVAGPYRHLEYLTLGRTLERTRLHYLSALTQQRRALVLGDGDGRFLAALLSQNPTLHADAVDASPAMLKLLHQRCNTTVPNVSARLQTHLTSALTFNPAQPKQQYDTVITHFFLDCLTQPEIEALISRTTPMLAPKALWLVSDFHIPTGSMRLPAKLLIRSLYLAFRILTGLRTTQLPDYAKPLTQAGFTRKANHQLLAGMLTTELWQTP